MGKKEIRKFKMLINILIYHNEMPYNEILVPGSCTKESHRLSHSIQTIPEKMGGSP